MQIFNIVVFQTCKANACFRAERQGDLKNACLTASIFLGVRTFLGDFTRLYPSNVPSDLNFSI